MTAALTIENLSYAYKGNWSLQRTLTLKPFSLEVKEGETFGFLGHNGAGKTTTIKCLLNLVNPASGTIIIFGKDFRDPQSRQAVGYIPEQPYFYDNLTVRETMWLYGVLSGLHGAALNREIVNCLERVGLAERSAVTLRTLSKGLLQRVALAQALLSAPRLMILDEPFSGLDPLGRREFREIFSDLKTKGATLFMSSHILSDVEFLCDRVSVLAHGELKGVFEVQDIPRLTAAKFELVLHDVARVPDEILKLASETKQQIKHLHILFDSKERSERALRMALDCGLAVESYQFVQGSLEELFVKLVNDKAPPLG